jgi:hemerythrin
MKGSNVSGSWKSHLEIGIPDIDAQHRELVEAIGALSAALAASHEDAVARTIECLTGYVLVHFEAEERWMRENRFPLVREHIAKHDQFVTRVVAMNKDYTEEGTSAVLKLRLRNALAWLEAHIEDDDRDFRRHVGASARPAPCAAC